MKQLTCKLNYSFLKSSPKDVFVDFRERGILVSIYAPREPPSDQALNSQPRYVR